MSHVTIKHEGLLTIELAKVAKELAECGDEETINDFFNDFFCEFRRQFSRGEDCKKTCIDISKGFNSTAEQIILTMAEEIMK